MGSFLVDKNNKIAEKTRHFLLVHIFSFILKIL